MPNQIVLESKLKAEDRNKLEDSEFGIPEERMFPLNDEAHVKAAARMFSRYHGEHKRQLAHRILRAAKKYNIDTDDWKSIREYLKKPITESEIFNFFGEAADIIPSGFYNLKYQVSEVVGDECKVTNPCKKMTGFGFTVYDKEDDPKLNVFWKGNKVAVQALGDTDGELSATSVSLSEARDVICKILGKIFNKTFIKESAMDELDDVPESTDTTESEAYLDESSKNPDVKARRKAVDNLRSAGVQRAHEIGNDYEMDKLKKEENKYFDATWHAMSKKYSSDEKRGDDQRKYFNHFSDAAGKIDDLERKNKNVKPNVKDSKGNKLEIDKMTFDKDGNHYEINDDENLINIKPDTLKSKGFATTFAHEKSHAEQHRNGIKFPEYSKDKNPVIKNNDDYAIKCAKMFVVENKDKLNSHDFVWTELHADYLAARQVGFGKIISFINRLKKSDDEIRRIAESTMEYYDQVKSEILESLSEDSISECISEFNRLNKKLVAQFDRMKSKMDQLAKSLDEYKGSDKYNEAYAEKYKNIYTKMFAKRLNISDKLADLKDTFQHNNIGYRQAKKLLDELNRIDKDRELEMEEIKLLSTTYDYRAKFIEDMKFIHDGQPNRCSMKYPQMTSGDKDYMQNRKKKSSVIKEADDIMSDTSMDTSLDTSSSLDTTSSSLDTSLDTSFDTSSDISDNSSIPMTSMDTSATTDALPAGSDGFTESEIFNTYCDMIDSIKDDSEGKTITESFTSEDIDLIVEAFVGNPEDEEKQKLNDILDFLEMASND